MHCAYSLTAVKVVDLTLLQNAIWDHGSVCLGICYKVAHTVYNRGQQSLLYFQAFNGAVCSKYRSKQRKEVQVPIWFQALSPGWPFTPSAYASNVRSRGKSGERAVNQRCSSYKYMQHNQREHKRSIDWNNPAHQCPRILFLLSVEPSKSHIYHLHVNLFSLKCRQYLLHTCTFFTLENIIGAEFQTNRINC